MLLAEPLSAAATPTLLRAWQMCGLPARKSPGSKVCVS